MAKPLPRLRLDLDFMPSPVEDRPGVLIRDSRGYSDAILVIPPPLVECLEFFDGEQTDLDLRQRLVEMTGQLDVSPIQDNLTETLSQAGFLHDELFEQVKEERHREFAESPLREPAHAGSAYPADLPSARATLDHYMTNDVAGGDPNDGEAARGKLLGIAAPHVSPFGGWQSYRAAYSALAPEMKGRTFVVLGTSHYGEPDRFGLTRKPYSSPFGTARTNKALVDELASEPAALMEDYCHSFEHSIEFQVLFLQYLFGEDIEVLPILCGSYARSIYYGGKPEDNEQVQSFLDRLGNIAAREGDKLAWVLGIDMAHIGTRYGDSVPVTAGEGLMSEVEQRDKMRIERVAAGDADGFWDLVKENQDDLKWCGSSPLYTFLRAVPGVQGITRQYEQWNIDEQSVVSFAAMSFSK